ncbi:MAG: spermidine synthase [Dehalococcoidia bacterium]
MDASGKWHSEVVTLELIMLYRIRDILHTGTTPYQKVDILDSESFGRCLVLDGKTQSTELDEGIYHECLVHPALLAHPSPQSIFIGGGGEGATLREVVELCRKLLPQHHQGAFDDPRVRLLHQDARAYLSGCQQSFDVMVLDLVDPVEGGPSGLLYTREFYQHAMTRLNPGGILVTQAGPTGLLNYTETFTAIARTLSLLFPRSWPYTVYVPSFITPWGFVMAHTDPTASLADPREFDALASRRLRRPLRFLDGITHRGLFSLPKYLREGIQAEQRTVTDAQPVFMI